MVEFGLKLEDNKVSEWDEYYIQYEKLKRILEKCNISVKKLKDLTEKRPEYAAIIIDSYKNGIPTPKTGSFSELYDLDESMNEYNKADTSIHSIIEVKNESNNNNNNNESTRLESNNKGYGTNTTHFDIDKVGDDGSSSIKRNREGSGGSLRSLGEASTQSQTSKKSLISRAINKATSGVSDYLQRSYERNVREVLKDIDTSITEFDTALSENISRVNDFYLTQLSELEGRVNYLKESAAHIRHLSTHDSLLPVEEVPDHEEMQQPEDDKETPLLSSRKSSSTTHRRTLSNPITFAKEFAHRVVSTTIIGAVGSHNSSNDNNQQQQQHYPDRQPSTENVAAPLLIDPDVESIEDDNVRVREVESIQRALVDHYRTAKLLHNFAIMNYTGFVKIVKKYDKTVPKDQKGKHKSDIQTSNICNNAGKTVETLINRMELLYSYWFCDRNISEARAQMHTKKGDGLEMDWSQLRLGYRMGMCSILALWVCWDCIWGLVSEGHTTIGGRTAFPVFRACGGLLLLQWCWGFSVWVWTRYRVNYIYLFDFNPNIVASPLAIFNDAVDNTLTYMILTLLYYKAGAHDIPGNFPAGIFPFILVIYGTYQLVFPLRTRKPMWLAIGKVITAPATSPSFFHGYVGDIFTSLVKVFQDLAWTVCFVLSGDWMISEDSKDSTKHWWARTTLYSKILIPLLTLLPLWFRFNQCLRRYTDTGKRFPHLANAFKYALSQTVTLFGAFHPLYMKNRTESQLFQVFWMLAFVSSSLYSFWWDVYQDWGLGQFKYRLLGPRLMYPRKAMYYSIMCIDLVLRFAWVLTLIPPESGATFALPAYLSLVSMMMEIFRRTIWGFLRLENEHRSNTAGFRRVNFVPLHFSTGHDHGYKQEEEHRGFSVLIEVAVVTILVLGAAVVSVVAAQHATERASGQIRREL